jgi:putative transcriptional regulator
MRSLQGQFLVASPHLPDPNFFRSVVLMVQHDEQGALGLILNRPTNTTIRELWKNLTGEECSSIRHVDRGGPVEGPLMALHTVAESADSEVIPGVYFASREEFLRKVVHEAERPCRVFLGYAGWGAGQLESELEVGGWLTAPATVEEVFGDSGDLWRSVAAKIGSEILKTAVKTKHVPQDPSVN